jgi:pimeloyl-ACP methyl ester carboxylesterase
VKQKLLILHGAAGSKKRFDSIAKALESKFDVYRMNFSGHGGESMPNEPFSIELFSRDVIKFMNSHELRQVNIFGFSMGGFVGLYLAAHHPERVLKVVTLGTKFNWNKETVRQQVRLLDPATIKEKLPAYAEELKLLHEPNDWEEVIKKTTEMLTDMGRKNPLSEDDLTKLEIPVLIGMGDRDNLVIIEESVYSYRLLKKGQLFIIPDTPHPIHNVNIDSLSREIERFISLD